MTNATTLVTCGKCGGNGQYKFRSGAIEVCYPCDGSGKVSPAKPMARGPVRSAAERAERTRLDLEAVYRNAKAGRTDYADCTDGSMWTTENFATMLALVPGSREAFASIGWPV